jgi:PII-like signaling protein
MQRFKISFLAEQNRRIEHKQAMDWLLHLAKELGISGCTVFSGIFYIKAPIEYGQVGRQAQ